MSVAVQGRYHYGGVAVNVELLNGIDVTAYESLAHHVPEFLRKSTVSLSVAFPERLSLFGYGRASGENSSAQSKCFGLWRGRYSAAIIETVTGESRCAGSRSKTTIAATSMSAGRVTERTSQYCTTLPPNNFFIFHWLTEELASVGHVRATNYY
ncbi:hypothetical protein P692DRAFT_20819841 [Suillus brevipes Sb2]|nr:hypothetical protein P692DRAFT_20819841 [Suillus brevipes Sb2]